MLACEPDYGHHRRGWRVGLAKTQLIAHERRIMVGPIEILIVLGAFGIVGVYLFIVSRFLREAEAETKRFEDVQKGAPH